ncbi:GntR family transcriptional regulator [Sulfitobacter sp. D35]|uniref:GntR family transcriptional regulator n=1 Tax=Sulfitobacter sp. D35 TaxID=3083252 RepID=UPI00296E7AE7|nr:GntR family transcriptional regulator [Sulfitobacter sp. D35]MDW4499670.1 GntR family transcriptional regulator [Sulfitobacter sp. D35]
MADAPQLRPVEPVHRPSVSDQVFEALYAQVLSLDLAPGTKISEAEVAKQLDVSRQPVRDAFWRLSQLGFLLIRPQRATVVSQISAADIFKARYIRTALEVETVRRACRELDGAQFDALKALIDAQRAALDAGDKKRFHELDDAFHRSICEEAGVGFCWDVIREKKAHTDRVRFLSLGFASQSALEDHVKILAAIRSGNANEAEAALRLHLGRIEPLVERLRLDNHEWFVEED